MTALLAGLVRRNVIELRRYAFDTVFQVAGIYVLFLAVFLGARGVGGPAIRHNGTLSSIVVGFLVVTLGIFSYSTIASWTTMEATLGTLEQLAMSPFGLVPVLVGEYIAGIVFQAVFMGGLLTAALLTTGQHLHLDLLTLVPLLGFLLAQMLGIGLMVGGAALVFKRIVSLINIIQFSFIGLVAAPVERYPVLKLLPVTLGNYLVRRNTVFGVGIADMGGDQLLLLAGVTVGYVILGVALFRWAERVARERGLIGVH